LRAVIQRTLSKATVTVDNEITGAIDKGLIVYLGISAQDTMEDITWLARKIINLRIFNDAVGKMNKSLIDISGGLLVISQFTLYASTYANKIYEDFIHHIQQTYDPPIATGIFGADMKVDYRNDGPVTIIIDTENKE